MLMTMVHDFSKKVWWDYIESDIKDLLIESAFLVEETKTWKKVFNDYSFVVFPAAKAYEGFLKKFFLDMGFITKEDYLGKHFRIGKSLNPNLERHLRDESWVYNRLGDFCGGDELPSQLWETWKLSRNLLFHWFPNQTNKVTMEEAHTRFDAVINALDAVFKVCDVQLR